MQQVLWEQFPSIFVMPVFVTVFCCHNACFFSLYAGGTAGPNTQSLATRKAPTMPKPQWHSPWKLFRVISGHTGWVRCVAVDPTNEWFCTGSADRVIKVRRANAI